VTEAMLNNFPSWTKFAGVIPQCKDLPKQSSLRRTVNKNRFTKNI